MATRKELIEGVGERYRTSKRGTRARFWMNLSPSPVTTANMRFRC
jgi:hypothetical protein